MQTYIHTYTVTIQSPSESIPSLSILALSTFNFIQKSLEKKSYFSHKNYVLLYFRFLQLRNYSLLKDYRVLLDNTIIAIKYCLKITVAYILKGTKVYKSFITKNSFF